MQDNIIEFNGKRYDAITGELLGKSHGNAAVPLAPARPERRSIDGVVHPGKQHHSVQSRSTTKPHTHTAAHATTKVSITKKKAHRAPAQTIKPHRPENAKTLMRRAVHKPNVTKKPAIKPQAPAEIAAKPASSLMVKRSVNHVDPVRKHRASQTPKSAAVRRFSNASTQQQAIPGQVVKPAPRAQQRPIHHRTTEHPKPKADIFEAAIARANSHERPPHHAPKHRKKSKLTSVVAAIAALVVMGGFLAYLNMPKIELKIASINAGFGAQMPAYNPIGYELADIENRPGKVTLSFRSGEHNYKLIQQPTDWNSRTLQDEIIASAGHKTIESNGRIVYIYDNTASWISGGVRYDLTGNVELDEDEIAAIAASI